MPVDVVIHDAGTGKWTNAAPSGGGGSGSLVLLEQHTALTSASLDFTSWYSSSYDAYVIDFVNVIPATNDTGLIANVSTDGGSSYDTSSVYARAYHYGCSNTLHGGGGETGQSRWDISGDQTNSSAQGACGSLRLFSPGSAAVYKQAVGSLAWGHTGVDWISVQMTLIWKATTAINAIRFAMTTGNIASGTIRIYGIAK